jgi:anti-sigma factor RsiW
VPVNDSICTAENIAAYVDGDVEPALRASLETHFKECARCASELQTQKLFMCELDSALASPLELEVPENFAQVIAVRAESDMRGVRDRAEHARALRFCIILGLAAFALLGFASSKAIFLNARSFASKLFGVVTFFGEAILNAATGFSVITRVGSRAVIADSRLSGFAGLLFVILAVAVLSRLIARYHRTRLIE